MVLPGDAGDEDIPESVMVYAVVIPEGVTQVPVVPQTA